MDLIKVFQRFPDHEACLEHLERVRWGDTPACPYCGGVNVARKADGHRVGRWNCHACKSSFNVLAKTIFQKTKIDLQKWFLALSIVLNAKKSVSSYQLARDLDLNQKTAWYIVMRIRRAMVDEGTLLSGIVEMDEAYVGGKPRRANVWAESKEAPRGRGTNKLPIVGAVERGGQVVAEPSPKVSASAIEAFLDRHVDPASLLVTDEFSGYNRVHRSMRHATVQHAVRYVDGLVHTNTIEGFWGLLKRAWYGQDHHYSREHSTAYVVEACYKYNTRFQTNKFGVFLQGAMAAR